MPYSARITVILSRSIAGLLAAIPSAVGISLAPIGFMMSDGTAHACPKEAVMPDEVPGDAADHRSFYASRRLGWAGRQTDNGKHRGCRNEHRLHGPSPKNWLDSALGV